MHKQIKNNTTAIAFLNLPTFLANGIEKVNVAEKTNINNNIILFSHYYLIFVNLIVIIDNIWTSNFRFT
jgi:hypothetical protein